MTSSRGAFSSVRSRRPVRLGLKMFRSVITRNESNAAAGATDESLRGDGNAGARTAACVAAGAWEGAGAGALAPKDCAATRATARPRWSGLSLSRFATTDIRNRLGDKSLHLRARFRIGRIIEVCVRGVKGGGR